MTPPAGQDRSSSEEQGKLSAEILVQDAQEAIEEQDLEGALELLRTAATLDPDRIELEGFVDGVRSQLLKRYRDRVGDLARAARIVASPSAITRFNLSPDVGFILSLLDGQTSAEDIISLSGMDAFDVFRILNGLLDAGIASFDS